MAISPRSRVANQMEEELQPKRSTRTIGGAMGSDISNSDAKTSSSKMLKLVIVTLALGTASTAYLWFSTTRKVAAIKSEISKIEMSKTTQQKLVESILLDVGKYVELPDDEIPSMATVTDLAKLKDQTFFAKAQIGDTLIVYAKSAKAILYRSKEKKIIEVANFNINDPSQKPATPAAASASPIKNTASTTPKSGNVAGSKK